jgi:hypothetical protein
MAFEGAENAVKKYTECLRAGIFEGKNPCPQRSEYKVLVSICTDTPIVNKDKCDLF